MTNFIGILHILAALILIVLVLIQDSKSDGALGIGGASGSNSLLGATGAQTLAGKMTVWAAIIFACTCLTLAVLTSSHTKSVVDGLPLPAAPVTQENPAAEASGVTQGQSATAPAATETTPAATAAPATK
ncbi:preprotein translocase subunit SecG [Bdellovibrio bacteriovorus]|uniref:Protein-export membrane protein SecG n=1 Tax=Bdellovibrio bacteriovorus TaxID=959 RepID=A0A150WEY3_BDEBC|nr:preprotein translocase subunit SecG [Bdellovibrio bacteriovorus]KYG61510.1 preprotein translocase subunit SecG [Bdellovibrio bacteriovorus]